MQRMIVFCYSFGWMKICKWNGVDDGNRVDGRWRWNGEMRRMALQKGVEMKW